jgi:hypothetical protein
MKVRGHGGFWALAGSDPKDPVAVAHNAEYEVVTADELKQSRTANGGGWTEGLPVVRRVESATFGVAEDDVGYPQALGFTEGSEITVYLRRGELNQYDRLTRTVVQRVRVTNDQQKARRVEVFCQHGRYERGVSAPLLPTPPPPPPDFGGGGDF